MVLHQENHPSLWQHALPQLLPQSNKYTRGHALIMGGYPMTGAARLAARAAARIGAGLTTLAVPEIAWPVYAASMLSIMVQSLSAEYDLEQLLQQKNFSAYLIGPGAGVSEKTRQQVCALLRTGCPIVLDADALTVFQDEPTTLDDAISGACVITPHAGEFGRLFSTQGDKVTQARTAAQRCGAIVVLKGSDTVIAAPDGRVIINTNAPPTLATAGAGDVLSGMITGLLAQGMDAFLAAAAAVWLHGAAATEFGMGLIAEDLPELLPRVLKIYTKQYSQRPQHDD